MTERRVLGPGDFLERNDYIRSPSGRLALILQGDGNLVLYDLAPDGYTPGMKHALWATGTQGSDTTRATVQTDGNLVLTNDSGTPRWASGTQGHASSSLFAQDDGNVVLYDGGGKAVWATDTDGFKEEQAFQDAKRGWLENIFVHDTPHPSLGRWFDWTKDIDFAQVATLFAGGVGFLVGGPAGSAAAVALMKSALTAAQDVQKGSFNAKDLLTFAQAAGNAAGVGVDIDTSSLPGVAELQAVARDARSVVPSFDINALGVDYPSIVSRAMPWDNPPLVALYESVRNHLTKVVDAQGNVILGYADAPNTVAALTVADLSPKQVNIAPGLLGTFQSATIAPKQVNIAPGMRGVLEGTYVAPPKAVNVAPGIAGTLKGVTVTGPGGRRMQATSEGTGPGGRRIASTTAAAGGCNTSGDAPAYGWDALGLAMVAFAWKRRRKGSKVRS